jgi:hypothetical protein
MVILHGGAAALIRRRRSIGYSNDARRTWQWQPGWVRPIVVSSFQLAELIIVESPLSFLRLGVARYDHTLVIDHEELRTLLRRDADFHKGAVVHSPVSARRAS